MRDTRDRAIEALCDIIADLRNRIAELDVMFSASIRPGAYPPGTQSSVQRCAECGCFASQAAPVVGPSFPDGLDPDHGGL